MSISDNEKVTPKVSVMVLETTDLQLVDAPAI